MKSYCVDVRDKGKESCECSNDKSAFVVIYCYSARSLIDPEEIVLVQGS